MTLASSRPWLVLGAGGQLGRSLLSAHSSDNTLADEKTPPLLGWGRAEADLTNLPALLARLDETRPAVIINAAAYTQVDRAEEEEELARRINAAAPEALARWCADHDAALIHVSTDYVFDGSGETPWKETDAPAPLNAYGRTKWEGEQAVLKSDAAHAIIRTSWLYSSGPGNFCTAMIRRLREGTPLRIVEDQIGAPTWCGHLAEALLTIAAHAASMPPGEFPSGLYHLCHGGETSWHGFTCAIREHLLARGESLPDDPPAAIPSALYPTPALRPFNSRLDCAKARNVFGLALPDWKTGLEACMQEI